MTLGPLPLRPGQKVRLDPLAATDYDEPMRGVIMQVMNHHGGTVEYSDGLGRRLAPNMPPAWYAVVLTSDGRTQCYDCRHLVLDGADDRPSESEISYAARWLGVQLRVVATMPTSVVRAAAFGGSKPLPAWVRLALADVSPGDRAEATRLWRLIVSMAAALPEEDL